MHTDTPTFMHISFSMQRSSRFSFTQPLRRMSRCVYGCLCAWCVCVCVCVCERQHTRVRVSKTESVRVRLTESEQDTACVGQSIGVFKVSVCSTKYRCVQVILGPCQFSLPGYFLPPTPTSLFPPPSSICALILQDTTYVIFSGKRETQ